MAAEPNPIDFSRLEDLVGADPEQIRHYLRMFARLTDAAIEQLGQAIGAGDPTKTREIAHKVKGSSAMVGAVEVAAVAARIEEQAGAGPPGSLGPLLAELRAVYATARAVAVEPGGPSSR